MKKLLVLRDKKRLKTFSTHILIEDEKGEYIIGYEQIKEIYLSYEFDVPIKELIKLSQYKPLFFIDNNGYVVARFCEVKI